MRNIFDGYQEKLIESFQSNTTATHEFYPFYLEEKHQTVWLPENECYGYRPNEILTKDFYTDQQLKDYLRWRRIEDNSIEFAKPILLSTGITITERSQGRFDHWDCKGYYYNKEKDKNIPLYLEFKNRPNITSDIYTSVIIDEGKWFGLNNLHEQTGVPILIVYVYSKDNRVRILNFGKNKDKYFKKEIKNVQDTVYNLNRRKDKVYYYYDNEIAKAYS